MSKAKTGGVNTGTVFRAAFAGCVAVFTKFGALAKAGGGAGKLLAAGTAAAGAGAGLYTSSTKK